MKPPVYNDLVGITIDIPTSITPTKVVITEICGDLDRPRSLLLI
jgi:hypothetical protein